MRSPPPPLPARIGPVEFCTRLLATPGQLLSCLARGGFALLVGFAQARTPNAPPASKAGGRMTICCTRRVARS